jgi:type I restriction enzyme, S subunit
MISEQWQIKPLGEIATVLGGSSAPQGEHLFEEGIYPFIRTADVGQIKFGEIFDTKDHLNEMGIEKLRHFKKGTILIPKSGASTFLNHRVIMGIDAYVASHLAGIIPDEAIINSRFLLYSLSRIRAQDLVQENAYPSLNLSLIKEIEISFPPLEEQQRIVSVLDDAFVDIEINSKQIQSRINDSNELLSSALSEMFSCPNVDWTKAKLNEITTKIGSGATPKGGKKSYKTEGVSLIRSMNIHDKYFKHKDLAYIDKSQAEKLSNVVVESNDVLLNITGASVARCNLAPREIIPARVNQHVMIIRPIHEKLNSKFLHFMLISKPYKDTLLAIGEQGGSTRQAITKSQVENFEISYPSSIQEQEGIVARITSLLIESEKLEGAYSRKLEYMDELKQSILQEAFSGKLTGGIAA